MQLFTNEIKGFIRQNVAGMMNKDLTDLVNTEFGTAFSIGQIKRFKQSNKLDSGLTGRFEKGQVPHNKGKKGIRYEGSEKTWFKKGGIPINHRPVGSERFSKDGYIEVKVAEPNKWRLKHNVVWESANGKIPKGHVVIFLDRNHLNLDIKNLKLITRSELLIMNRYDLFNENAEVTDTTSNIARVISKSNEIRKKRQTAKEAEIKP